VAWSAWTLSQAYGRTPSEFYGIQAAAGLILDIGIMAFGKHVEAVVQNAGQDAISPAFAKMQEMRAFAELMGDDMSQSNVGFADPFADGLPMDREADEQDEILASGY